MMDLGASGASNGSEDMSAKVFSTTSAGKKKLEGNVCGGGYNIKLDLKETCIEFTHNSPTIRGGILNIPDWRSHLYSSCYNAKRLS
jgi:hypothetical protein